MNRLDGLDMKAVLRRVVTLWELSDRSRAALCRAAGVSESQLSRALSEQGDVPKAGLVWDIATAAGLTITVTLAPDDK